MAPGGYAWWYLDALSDDGAHGLTIIAFIGSVFSPYYARARAARGAVPPTRLEHCAINVALYGPERGRVGHDRARARAVQRDASTCASARARCTGTATAAIDIDE